MTINHEQAFYSLIQELLRVVLKNCFIYTKEEKMKGIVFKEFLQMVEDQFGYNLVDQIITDSKIASNGAFTNVGTYSHQELFKLVEELCKHTGQTGEEVLIRYGKHAFHRFVKVYPDLTSRYSNSFDLLSHIEDTIHVEVLKLYPEAELPTLEIVLISENELKLIYFSQRRMSAFAEGMIQSCLNFYQEKAVIHKEILEESGTKVLFSIKKKYD